MSFNSILKHAGRNRLLNRSLALLLALVFLLALLPQIEIKAEAAFYDEAVQKLIGWNVMQGYPDGSLHADSNITRAEFVSLINRAYGYDETGATPFTDVPDYAWYHDDISAAYAAGYFSGTSTTTATPAGDLTREQAMVMLARNMRLEESPGEVTNFSDGRSFQSYSAGYANAAVQRGIISGYSDGSFRPAGNITRGEMAVMLSRALGNLVNNEGIYALGDVFGNVTINTTNVTLRDTTIAGDLYLTGGVGLGGVTLENVTVLGDIIVAGGGESDAGESVILRDVTADNIIVNTLLDQYLSLRAEGNTNIGTARLISDAYLQDRTVSGLGFQTIRLEGAGGTYSLSGNLENIINAAPGSALRLSQAIAANLTMDEAAVGSSLWLDSNATVLNLSLDTGATVSGLGDIRKLNVNVAGATVEKLPDEIEIRPGLTASIAGETMDTTAAAESSSEPRLLANYPNMTNVAATSATANFSTNKAGTIYWAVTAISDGSVDEEALLTPSAKSSIVKSGNLPASRSNTVYSVNITGLTTGGNYYLSAMLADARGDYSPIKVVSFTTTDNTTPAFGSGFPHMVQIEDTYASAAVMANKDCQLYWVVFDKGSAAPTAASFRSGAFTGAYGYGVMDMQRNISTTFQINNLKDLEELQSYDVYFWLNDSNSAKSSAVKKLSFTTADRTPPEFNVRPMLSATAAATSLKLTTNLNEAGTVYWVIVEASVDYPKQPNTSIKDGPLGPDKQAAYEEYFKVQIANGTNGLKSGSVKVKANTDHQFTISGLQGETRYKIYYIAKDTAGNFSKIYSVDPWVNEGRSGYTLTSNYLTQSTLDNREPSVTQDFTNKYLGQPYADTHIQIIFSEAVQRFSTLQPLEEVYKAGDRDRLAELLRNTIKLYPISGTTPVNERNKDNHTDDDDWVIDYRFAEVTLNQNGEMVVTFFTRTKADGTPSADSALNLNSDTTYHFEVTDIADTADMPNLMGSAAGNSTIRLENFTTRAARVDLAELNLGSETITLSGSGTTVDGIKAGFSMSPSSVSRADPEKSWDMLIWADHSVTFELYEQKQSADAGTRPVAGEWKRVMTVDGNGATGNIVNPGNSGFRGISFWRHVRDSGITFPFIRDDSNNKDENPEYYGLEDNTVYFYAIRILTVENQPAKDWYEDVHFMITVNTGTGPAFAARVGSLTEENYAEAIDPETKLNPLTQISVYGEEGDDFIITAPFIEKEAPMFTESYPQLDVLDTSLRMTLQLERKGTVYCVVAPVSKAGSMRTTRAYRDEIFYTGDEAPKPSGYSAGDVVNFDDLDVPLHGGSYHDAAGVKFYDGSIWLNEWTGDEAKWYPLYVNAPDRNAILGQNFANANVQCKVLDLDGVGTETYTFHGLIPDTEYFIYFVIQGKDEVSRYAQVYQFKTGEGRPRLTLTPVGSLAVNLNSPDSQVKAVTEYALFQADRISSVPLLSMPFYDDRVMVDSTTGEDYKGEIGVNDVDSNGNKIREYKVYEAIQNSPTGYESYFDLYATTSFKSQIYQLIKQGSGDDQIYQGGPQNPTDIPINGGLTIDCDKEFTINDQVEYFILTASRNSNAEPDAYGNYPGNFYTYRAYQPIRRISYDMPQLSSVSGNIKVYYKNDGTLKDAEGNLIADSDLKTNPVIVNDLTMSFNKVIWYYNKANESTNRSAINQYTDEGTSNGTNYVSATTLRTGGNGGLTITPDAGSGSDEDSEKKFANTQDIKLHVGDAYADRLATITLGGWIATANSDPLEAINLDVNLNAGNTGNGSRTPTISCYFRDDPDNMSLWALGSPNINVTVEVISTEPTVTDIEIRPSPLVFNDGGGEQWLQAWVRYDDTAPAGPSTVKWSLTQEDNCSIQLGSNSTIGADDPNNSSNGGKHYHVLKVTAYHDGGEGNGTAILTASFGGVEREVKITVFPATPPVNDNSTDTNIVIPPVSSAPPAPSVTAEFKQGEYTVQVNKTLHLRGELSLTNGADLTDASIEWVTSDDEIVAVSRYIMGSGGNEGGIVTGRNRPGESATITATITLDGKTYVATVTVTVARSQS